MPDGPRSDRDTLIARFLAAHGWAGAERWVLAGDASFRRYDRLEADGRRAVLMDAPPPKENVRPFVTVDRLLGAMGYSVPRIFAADEDAGLLLLEDLGDDTYTRLLARGADERRLYMLAVDLLIDLHRRFAPERQDRLPEFDDARALREVGLLLDWYWPATQGGPVPDALRAEYIAAWSAVLPQRRRVADSFVFFDFHVDNLLWLPDRMGVAACGLLDFQDAVIAPRPFDLMSLIEDARRDVPPTLAAELRAHYLAASPDLDPEDFATAFAVVGAQRHSRIIGTFTRLLVRDGKSGYLVHMPRVWRQLEGNLAHPALAPVRAWFEAHLPPPARRLPTA
ncbi:phosphotransferase [Rhodospirillaceae bacterium SYSU D60014]|uniref:aminoglycoside phosphotransferase family protein n=1 Tax=Virgifigura deserti TaxID=2268457 RepID=UPI000E66CD43